VDCSPLNRRVGGRHRPNRSCSPGCEVCIGLRLSSALHYSLHNFAARSLDRNQSHDELCKCCLRRLLFHVNVASCGLLVSQSVTRPAAYCPFPVYCTYAPVPGDDGSPPCPNAKAKPTKPNSRSRQANPIFVNISRKSIKIAINSYPSRPPCGQRRRDLR
jgi:hypothetical protein